MPGANGARPDLKECPWCAAIRKGDARFPDQVDPAHCPQHKAIWIAAATGALAYARLHITRGKWMAHWTRCQAEAVAATGCRPLRLRDGSIGVVNTASASQGVVGVPGGSEAEADGQPAT